MMMMTMMSLEGAWREPEGLQKEGGGEEEGGQEGEGEVAQEKSNNPNLKGGEKEN